MFKTKVVEIIVNANKKKTKISFNEKKNVYEMDVAAPAENNKANEAIIRYLQKLTGRKVKIVKGKTSRRKTVKVD